MKRTPLPLTALSAAVAEKKLIAAAFLELLRRQTVAWFKHNYPLLIYAIVSSHDQKY
jgi:hypothetical protein